MPAMPLSELIAEAQEILANYGDLLIVVQRDQEGNGYQKARGIQCCFSTDLDEWVIEDVEDWDEDSEYDAPNCVVIYP